MCPGKQPNKQKNGRILLVPVNRCVDPRCRHTLLEGSCLLENRYTTGNSMLAVSVGRASVLGFEQRWRQVSYCRFPLTSIEINSTGHDTFCYILHPRLLGPNRFLRKQRTFVSAKPLDPAIEVSFSRTRLLFRQPF